MGPSPHWSWRRVVAIAILVCLALWVVRIVTVYTVRSTECVPRAVDPSTRVVTRNDRGHLVSYPERIGFPAQKTPLTVVTYNIEGHDEVLHGDHAAKIAAVVRSLQPDIVGLEEVHRGTWQVRFRDQAGEIARATGLHLVYGPSYASKLKGAFGNALLTRGEVLSSTVHPLPSYGEPRSVLDVVLRIDGAVIEVYVAHLTAWASLNSKSRGEQLECVDRLIRSSRYPYLLLGDFNAPPDAPEVARFRREGAAQIVGEDIGITHPRLNKRIDYIFADYGWEVRGVRAVETGPSDHWPVVAELFWSRQEPPLPSEVVKHE